MCHASRAAAAAVVVIAITTSLRFSVNLSLLSQRKSSTGQLEERNCLPKYEERPEGQQLL